MQRILTMIGLMCCTLTANAQPDIQPDSEPRAVEVILQNTEAVRDLVDSRLGTAFLDAASDLPLLDTPRTVYWNRQTRIAMTEAEYGNADDLAREGFEKREYDEQFYYFTGYGTPIAYARMIDLAGQHGIESFENARVLDFGFGGIGHLRMMASCGAHCVGLEVLDLLRALYSDPLDTGSIENTNGSPGSISLLYGRYPAEQHINDAVGTGYDLIISKNTLKLGYIHPQREADPHTVINLGVNDEIFLQHMFDALEPNGLLVVYNIYPPQNPPDEQYMPWATGEFPFDRTLVEGIGFEVIKWNVDDTPTAQAMAQRFEWADESTLDQFLGMYTILKRPVQDTSLDK
ncbi:MAG: hypothetical protein H6815_11445 [Phycisphaeraceae bacterium]|nr:hypothetical protein [Phycisphaerales bacterium]MCB9861052.1 hypothetical protein [Phycisphaeraceae bacterium]